GGRWPTAADAASPTGWTSDGSCTAVTDGSASAFSSAWATGAPATSAGQSDVTRVAGAAMTGAPASRVLACTAGGGAPSIAAIARTPSTAATGTSTAVPGVVVVVSS